VVDVESTKQFKRWNDFTEFLKRPLLRGLVFVAKTSATYPLYTIISCISFSLFISVVGMATNYELETDGNVLWTPVPSLPVKHGDWVASEESGFPTPPRPVQVILHRSGNDVLGMAGANRVFDIVDLIRTTDGYGDLCALYDDVSKECPIVSVTRFWPGHNRTLFREEVKTDEEAIYAMSNLTFANGEPVSRPTIFGFPVPNLSKNLTNAKLPIEDVLLESAQSYFVQLELPPNPLLAEPYELDLTNNLFDLKDKWERDGTGWVIELNTQRSFDDELTRGISEDIPLMVVAFILMGTFCAVTLGKCHKVKSQALLGVGAVVTIILSLMTGYGLLFCFGVPLTNLTTLFPYVMVGIGLDDTFIITGAFARQDPSKPLVDRIEHVMKEVGISITVSTLTTFVAFFLGSLATIPGVRWFCFYAAPTVMIDFIYQLSFFVAVLAFDDRRMNANRIDCCICFKAKVEDETLAEAEETNERAPAFTTKMMLWYSDILLKPATKVLVFIVFAVLLVLGAMSASQQKQELDFRELTPVDSFIRTYFVALDSYSDRDSNTFFIGGVYFRDVDVSQKSVQDDMDNYIQELVDLSYISDPPATFWLRDFRNFVNQTEDLEDLAFFDQLDVFLNTSPFDGLYKNDVVRNEDGFVTASRTYVNYDQVSGYDTAQQIDALYAQRAVYKELPVNDGLSDYKFMSWSEIYYAWELYATIVGEIIATVAYGLVAVFLVGLIFLPHPLGAVIVTLVVGIIYIELLGVLQVAGLYINSVTAIGLIMSIGLVVDYNMHIVLTFFETTAATRNERSHKVLNTIGKSILLGGFSTFLGVLPLAFSSSEIFRTFFISFLGIVFLGAGHGLVFTPVVLSLIGPHVATPEIGTDGESVDPENDVPGEVNKPKHVIASSVMESDWETGSEYEC